MSVGAPIPVHPALAYRLGPRSVGVQPPHDVHVGALHRAPQRGRVGHEVHVRTAQPGCLAAPQPGTGQQHHDEPVTRAPARAQQRENLLVGGPVTPPPGHADTMLRLEPANHRPARSAGLQRQVTDVADLVQQRQLIRRRGSDFHRMAQERPDAYQDAGDPGRAAHRLGTRSGQHQRRARSRSLRASQLPRREFQPRDEQRQVPGRGPPVPCRPPAPPQEQRHGTRIRLGRQLRLIPPEPHMPQEPIRDLDHRQLLIQHRPVPLPGRQHHWKYSHHVPLFSRCATCHNENLSPGGAPRTSPDL